MYQTQLFNVFKRIDDNHENLLIRLLTIYPQLVKGEVYNQVHFLMDFAFTTGFKVSRDNNHNLHITNDGYDLTFTSIERPEFVYNGVTYTGVVERYGDFISIICAGEVVGIFSMNTLSKEVTYIER